MSLTGRLLNLRALISAASVTLLVACGGESGPERVVNPPECALAPLPTAASAPSAAIVPAASPFDSIFVAAGSEAGVPAAVLRAIGYVETRWQMVDGHEEFDGVPAAHGVMALRGERLRTGAYRAGLDERDVRRDPGANIRAAAALLRAFADSLDIDAGDEIDAWKPVVDAYSGIGLAAARASFVADVFSVIAGRRSAPATAAASPADGPLSICAPLTDQAGATWRASPNFNQRQVGVGGQVHIVIIHSCEGSYAGCWSWLANVESQVSAHYVVREDGAEITQLVREASRAWHIGATYDSTLNAGHDGRLHGVQSNHFTIGIEHGGYASQLSWPVAQIDASARLVCDIAKRWNIPRDRLHIVSHGQLQPWNRTDPGANWPWEDYMARINRYCA